MRKPGQNYKANLKFKGFVFVVVAAVVYDAALTNNTDDLEQC